MKAAWTVVLLAPLVIAASPQKVSKVYALPLPFDAELVGVTEETVTVTCRASYDEVLAHFRAAFAEQPSVKVRERPPVETEPRRFKVVNTDFQSAWSTIEVEEGAQATRLVFTAVERLEPIEGERQAPQVELILHKASAPEPERDRLKRELYQRP